VIETRVTHTKKSRSAFDGYNRGQQWALTGAEVAKLRLTRSVGAGSPLATVSGSSSRNVVEAAGVEPSKTSYEYEHLPAHSMVRIPASPT
jgi:hypothetical protein